jgi:hypothetical protein
MREQNLQAEADADGANQGDHQSFDEAKSLLLEEQNHQHIECGETYSHQQRDVKEKIQRDSGTDNLGQIAGGDRDFRKDPQRH